MVKGKKKKKTRIVKNTRKYNGKTFKLADCFSTKSEANHREIQEPPALPKKGNAITSL